MKAPLLFVKTFKPGGLGSLIIEIDGFQIVPCKVS